MTFDEYQEGAWRTFGAKDCTRHEKLTAVALGLGGESGEVMDHIKKILFHGHPFSQSVALELIKELGDVLYYIAMAAQVLGYDLERVAQLNNAKLQERYPEGFSTERSIKRGTENE